MTQDKTLNETVQSPGDDRSCQKALACARAAIDKKAENVKILNLTDLSGFTDYFVICSGMSDRQVQAMADSIENALSTEHHELLNAEGYSEGRWVLMDFGDVVVHIFLDALREYYDLENLWADAPRVKIPSEYYGPAASRLN
jgi:ribosome-associated protein